MAQSVAAPRAGSFGEGQAKTQLYRAWLLHCLAVLLAAWLWLASPPTVGLEPPPPRAEVRWTAPPGCPSAAEFAARVDALSVGAELTASFEFVVDGSGPFTLHVRGSSSRYVADACAPLAETALLLISLALVSRASEPEPQSQPAPAPATQPSPTARRPRLSASERRREIADVAPHLRANPHTTGMPASIGVLTAARLRVELGAGSGITPGPAPELILAAGPRGDVWAVDLGLVTRPAFRGDMLEPGIGARLSTIGALARVCAGPRPRRIGVAACAALEFALVSARPLGDVADVRVGRQPWLVLAIGPDMTVPIARRVALISQIAGTWLAVRPAFGVANAGLVCCRDALGLSARVGLEFGLGR